MCTLTNDINVPGDSIQTMRTSIEITINRNYIYNSFKNENERKITKENILRHNMNYIMCDSNSTLGSLDIWFFM